MSERYTPLFQGGNLGLGRGAIYSVLDTYTQRTVKRGETWLMHLSEDEAKRHADELNVEEDKRQAAGEGPRFVPSSREPSGYFSVKDLRSNKSAIGKDGKPLENMSFMKAAKLAEEMNAEREDE